MIRSVLLFLAGVVVALAVVYLVERKMVQNDPGEISLLSDLGAVDLRLGGLGGGGSGIRVVGGSLTEHISKTYHWESEDQKSKKLIVENADAWTFALENFREKQGGTPLPLLGYPHLSDRWTIIELVYDSLDSNRGIRITATTGVTPSNGTVTFVPLNDGDSFVVVPAQRGEKKPVDYLYYNQHCSLSDTYNETCASEKLREVQVYLGGSSTPDVWYCDPVPPTGTNGPYGMCHVDSGATQ
jgi:hypothetical protein